MLDVLDKWSPSGHGQDVGCCFLLSQVTLPPLTPPLTPPEPYVAGFVNFFDLDVVACWGFVDLGQLLR